MNYQITEYGSFVCERTVSGYTTLDKKTFSSLKEFVLSNANKETEALEIMGYSVRKGVGEIITAKNYVGVITMKDGTTIEILPKIHSSIKDEDGEYTKKLLVEMLKTLKNSPFKSFQNGRVGVDKINIFEIFIRMFLDEALYIVKRGLKRNYESVEENARFFKGKMLFSKQIRHNSAHKERNYVQYDEYSLNRAENKLLKATLLYLYKHSAWEKNRNDIRLLLSSFGEVDASTNYKADFEKCTPDRNMKDYETALNWSRVFLMGQSFTTFAGSQVAVALLFPMEKLFESYVANALRKRLSCLGYTVSAQAKDYHLFYEKSRGYFSLKPDIVITRISDGAIFIMDTKWKVLHPDKANYGISQGDMYQMYAYQKEYKSQRVTLLYPKTENMTNEPEFLTYDKSVLVNVRFVDLFNINDFLDRIQGEV